MDDYDSDGYVIDDHTGQACIELDGKGFRLPFELYWKPTRVSHEHFLGAYMTYEAALAGREHHKANRDQRRRQVLRARA